MLAVNSPVINIIVFIIIIPISKRILVGRLEHSRIVLGTIFYTLQLRIRNYPTLHSWGGVITLPFTTVLDITTPPASIGYNY